jgi:hypothetical protein
MKEIQRIETKAEIATHSVVPEMAATMGIVVSLWTIPKIRLDPTAGTPSVFMIHPADS